MVDTSVLNVPLYVHTAHTTRFPSHIYHYRYLDYYETSRFRKREDLNGSCSIVTSGRELFCLGSYRTKNIFCLSCE